MNHLDEPIESLTKLPKPQIAALKKLGLTRVGDLLLHFPYRYLDFSKTAAIKDLKPNENVSVKGVIKSINSRFSFRGQMSLAEAIISDDTGSIKIVWFNQPYLAKTLKTGDEVFIAGTPEIYSGILQFTNPIYEKASGFPVHTSRLLPLYHLTAKLYHKTLRNLIAKALPFRKELVDNIPKEILQSQALPHLAQTVSLAHFPEKHSNIDSAKKRLAFEEIFINQLAAQKYKLTLAQKQAYQIKFDQRLIKNFVDTLPFKLTIEQKKAAWDILLDLQKPGPMNRLLEGDVGSGKTLVALIAALQAMANSFQVAFLAPTEILARQHYNTAKTLFSGFSLSTKNSGRYFLMTNLLTNNYFEVKGNKATRLQVQTLIAGGEPGLYVGTHALLQNKIKFSNLALAIIDEQHRFGVEQRAKLMATAGKAPHLLSLSATPIPRSLQLAFYGELDVSQIKTKPAGRKNIITRVVDETNRPQTYAFLKKQIHSGRQVFVITPLIEESDKLGARSAKSEADNLKKIFPEFQIGLLHGKMKSAEKENVMRNFLENKVHILVSTSVVEVGVDAPNASVMVIEGAERFGLSQLHQFRGRVGRANHQSYCLLFLSLPYLSKNTPNGVEERDGEDGDAEKRLELFAKTHDGFELAEFDLKFRGFGEIYGQAQTGWDFKYFNPSYAYLIEPARKEARKLLFDDIDLAKYPELRNKIENKTIHFE
ncbi:MAG: ATP-dependent DNA helicase RecG [Candidatus Doudnabacteria bacterium]|nr:ATP-dependent DNA helicase RecG [Candidatus Doudnabacteria bacterium]